MSRIYRNAGLGNPLICKPRFGTALIKIALITGKLPESIYPIGDIYPCIKKHHFIELSLYILGIRPSFIRNTARAYHIAIITRVIGTILSKEMGPVFALELAEAAIFNAAYREALRSARRSVLLGNRLSDTFTKFPDLFPSIVTQSIYTSELIGELSENLLYIADIYDEQIQENFDHLIRPLPLIPVRGFVPVELLVIFSMLMLLSTTVLLTVNPL